MKIHSRALFIVGLAVYVALMVGATLLGSAGRGDGQTSVTFGDSSFQKEPGGRPLTPQSGTSTKGEVRIEGNAADVCWAVGTPLISHGYAVPVSPQGKHITPGRYDGIELTADDLRLVAEIVAIEARGEPFEGQVAVAAVIFNRVLSPDFPDTAREVIFDRRYCQQFTSTDSLGTVNATDKQYEAIEQALCGDPIIPEGVIYFSVAGENSRVWGTIGNHTFCYK